MPEKIRIILKRFLLILILFSVSRLNAQEMWGIAMSNYAGSSGAIMNPSSIVSSKLYMDMSILTVDIFADNNYLFMHGKDFGLGKLLQKNPQLPSYPPFGSAVDYSRTTDAKNAYVSVLVHGPSFMLASGRHAFSAYIGTRVLSSVFNMPYDVANFAYIGLKYTEQQNINFKGSNYGMATLALGEVGVTYAYSLVQYNLEDLAVGVTLKGLFGISGGYLYTKNSDYIVVNDSSINIRNLTAEAGMSIPINYNNNDYPAGSQIKGTGVGVDIGITYEKKLLSYQKRRIQKLCDQRYNPYIYKLGISLIDIGAVRFTQNTQVHSFDNVSKYWMSIDTILYRNMNSTMSVFSRELTGNPNQSFKSNSMSIFLPAAASIQADYRFYRNWYVSGAFIQPLMLTHSTVHRPTQIMFGPRYETAHFEFSIPVSLYEWRYPRLGFALRYEFLTVGTDKLNALFGIPDFTGMDIYFSVKLNFSKGNCPKGRNNQCENDEYGAFKLKGRKHAKHYSKHP